MKPEEQELSAKTIVFGAWGHPATTGKYKHKAHVTLYLNDSSTVDLNVRNAEKALKILTKAIAAAKGEKTNG